jgi:hypothetical protein
MRLSPEPVVAMLFEMPAVINFSVSLSGGRGEIKGGKERVLRRIAQSGCVRCPVWIFWFFFHCGRRIFFWIIVLPVLPNYCPFFLTHVTSTTNNRSEPFTGFDFMRGAHVASIVEMSAADATMVREQLSEHTAKVDALQAERDEKARLLEFEALFPPLRAAKAGKKKGGKKGAKA